jgi:UDP:flavonoid glycosyltransferase YjiC (YdhE family)
MKALAAGVPMVCIPMGRDQNDTAVRVTQLGAGVQVSPKASPARIRRAVERVLGDPRYRNAAQRAAAAIERESSSADVVRELEAVTGAGRESPYASG